MIKVWRWNVPNPDTPITDAIILSEAVRNYFNKLARETGIKRLPDEFHGGKNIPAHIHSFWLPEDEDMDGYIDHFLIYCENGRRG